MKILPFYFTLDQACNKVMITFNIISKIIVVKNLFLATYLFSFVEESVHEYNKKKIYL